MTRDNPWYFRVIYDDRAQGRFVTAYVAEVLGAERFGIAHETEAYGAYLAEVMQATAPEVGTEVTGRWSFDPADPRLDALLAAIAGEVSAASGPPVLVLAMQPEAGIALVKHLRDRGFDGELVVTDALAPECDRVIGDLAVGESTSYQCEVEAVESFTNVAVTTGTDPQGGSVTDDDDADVVIIDCGAGVGANVIAFTLAADCTLTVTTPV